ncbi:MAG: glycosyltransferase [Sphaerospermopsis kisseleviana]
MGRHYPRLLYWADLPVSATRAGPMLMHRLLKAWPADKLMVVTPGAKTTCDLPGVKKVQPPPARLRRLFNSRFAGPWTTVVGARMILGAAALRGAPPRWLAADLEKFSPQAVLTVGVSATWVSADALARRLGIPLHLIIHDDHHYADFWCRPLKPFGEKLFGQTYRRAASRLCVSRPMEREYERRFGVAGDVLLPSRDAQAVVFDKPRAIASGVAKPAKIFYAGSITRQGFREVDAIAGALRKKGHRLILYSGTKPSDGFTPQHMERREPVPAAELVQRLHEEADLLLLYTDFSSAMRGIVKTLFPSKLVDYTAAAVPIMVVAPDYACIVDYLQGRPKTADLVTDNNPEFVASAIEQLLAQPEKRKMLAEGAVEVGWQDFEHAKVFGQFARAMLGKPQ